MSSPAPLSTDGRRLLEPGMRLSQEEFHRRYEQYPADVKFELVDGVVYMASPQKQPHGRYQAVLAAWLVTYESATPGVETLCGSTAILEESNEPQPDLMLRILPSHGGKSSNTADGYIIGPPELLVEISHTTEYLDREKKGPEYEQTGVSEYLLVLIERQEIHWFDFRSGGMIEPNRRSIARSRIFPGLWLHIPALLRLDSRQLTQILQRGLDSREHRAFVKRLARRAEGTT